MKIIIAKQSGRDRKEYIVANSIESFAHDKNPYNGTDETRIYFFHGDKIVIDGDQTKEISEFMATDDNSGILNLVKDEDRKSFWDKINGEKPLTFKEGE